MNRNFKKFIYQAIISYFLILLTSYICLNIFGLKEQYSFICSIIISFFYNFLFTIKITFKKKLSLVNFKNYLIFTFVFRTIEYFLFLIVRKNSDENYFIIITLILIISFLLKFITLKLVYEKNEF